MADLGSIGASGFIVYGSNTKNSAPNSGFHVSGSISKTGTVGSFGNTTVIWYSSKVTGNLRPVVLVGSFSDRFGEKSFTFTG